MNIPVLSLTNTTGYEASVCAEKHLAKALGKMVYAFANATVPKISFLCGQALGSAYVTMNAKSLGADLVFAFADAMLHRWMLNLQPRSCTQMLPQM